MREGWVETTLGAVADWFSGATPRASERSFYGGEVPWAVIADVQNRPIWETASTLSPSGVAQVGRLAPVGAVLVTMYGSIGRTALVKREMATNQAIAWGVPRETVTSEYLFLLTQSVAPYLDGLGRGATQRNINRELLRGVPVLVPPLCEQRRIVDLIGALDDTIAAAEDAREHARTTARLVRADAFADHLSAHSVSAGEKFDMLLGRQKSARQTVGDHVIPYLRAANITSDGFRLEDVQTMNFSPQEQEKYCLRPDDVMLVEGGSLGQSSMWSGEIEGPVGFDKHVIRLRAIEGVSLPEYALQWTRWAHESGAFDEQATGVTIRALGFGRASSMPVPDITIEQQERLVAPLAAADRVISDTTSAVRSLRMLRSNLLTALLSGEHEIPETYDDVLEAV